MKGYRRGRSCQITQVHYRSPSLMLPRARNSKLPKPGLFPLMASVLLAGCSFIPNHYVAVDAISGFPATPQVGPAYKLADKDPLVVRDASQHKRVFGCVAAALETKGVYEALPGAK